MERKYKLAFTALALATLDLIAILIIGYLAIKLMNLIAWAFLSLLILIMGDDCMRAIKFIKNLFE